VNRQDVREIITIVIDHHPKECIFVPNVVDEIMLVLSDAECEGPPNLLVDLLERHILSREIYCPYEGIDRRTEFGL